MAKLTAWLVTLIGVLLALDVLDLGVDVATLTITNVWAWILAAAVLIVGIGKLVRNYSGRRKK